MNWKNYSQFKQSHAFLSASKYHWLRYDADKLMTSYANHQKAQLGTKYHILAANMIDLAIKLPDIPTSYNQFVNDGIGFRMSTEITLVYSPNAYGTADAICYRDGTLRIHDLKTGVTPGSIDQLMIYAALFCLDYGEEPNQTILRIYQNDEVLEYEPDFVDVEDVIDKLVAFDKLINQMKEQAIF